MSMSIHHIIGHDSNGHPVKIGERDSDGHPVGYIDAEGLAWESKAERDEAVGAGRLLDAMREQPFAFDADRVLDAHGIGAAHRAGALAEALSQKAMIDALRR